MKILSKLNFRAKVVFLTLFLLNLMTLFFNSIFLLLFNPFSPNLESYSVLGSQLLSQSLILTFPLLKVRSPLYNQFRYVNFSRSLNTDPHKIDLIPCDNPEVKKGDIHWRKLAIKVYENAKSDRLQILKENKGKSGIYLWTNCKTGKQYVGQSKDLGNPLTGRLTRYFHKSFLSYNKRSKSLLRLAILKYGHDSFSVAILEYCNKDQLDSREQYWLDLLKPEYNILKFASSSQGYNHTPETLEKMKGPRPTFKHSPEVLAKIALSNKDRIYTQKYREMVSEREGTAVYVYDEYGKFIQKFPSIVTLKKAYGLTMHHKTLYKKITQGVLFNNHKFSFVPLNFPKAQIAGQNSEGEAEKSVKIFTNPIILLNKNNPKRIRVENVETPELSKNLDSLIKAADYIKNVEGSVDKTTMRKYINTNKLYKKKWKLFEIF